MSIFYSFGDAIVSEEELREKQALGHISNFLKTLEKKPSEAEIVFSTGILTDKTLNKSLATYSGAGAAFEPVNIGNPLNVELRHVYTGKYPKDEYLFGSSKKDMLVTSAIKSTAAYDAAPRAINCIKKGVSSRHNMKYTSATDNGTQLIYYSPALTVANSVVTMEIGFDEFPEELFDAVGKALIQAAGIPVFVSASSYLLAAGALTKLIGAFASKLFDHGPIFKATDALLFQMPGEIPPQADFRVVLSEGLDPTWLGDYKAGPEGLAHKDTHKPYDGDIPYIIISLDGRKCEEYSSYTPTSASAAILDRFYKIKEGEEEPLGVLLDALKLYNDISFRKKADKASNELKNLEEGSEAFKKKQSELAAYVANIMEELLKPSVT